MDGMIADGAMPEAAAVPRQSCATRCTWRRSALRDLRLDRRRRRRRSASSPGRSPPGCSPVEPEVRDGWAVASPARDLLKLVCVERHHATGRVGVGYVQGFGLQRGALASSIAHDAHNIVAVGADDADLLLAIATVAESEGGLAAVADGKVLAQMALPVAGILSDRPLPEVAARLRRRWKQRRTDWAARCRRRSACWPSWRCR